MIRDSTRVWKSAYVLAALLVATPLIDLATQVMPFQPGSGVWRYGVLGMLGNNLLTPLLGAVIAGIAAASLEHVRAIRIFSIGAGTLCLVIAGLALFFLLDVVQLRPTVEEGARSAFDLGAGLALGKFCGALLGFLVLWMSLRAEVRLHRSGRRLLDARSVSSIRRTATPRSQVEARTH